MKVIEITLPAENVTIRKIASFAGGVAKVMMNETSQLVYVLSC